MNKDHKDSMKVDYDELDKIRERLLTDPSYNDIEITEQPTGLQQTSNLVTFHINKNQYLSDIKDDILKNLSHITLLEAGAGYGKTEMIKAFKAKTCLILPFTSTIKAKVEKSETTEDWLYYYGNKRPTLDELLGNHNM